MNCVRVHPPQRAPDQDWCTLAPSVCGTAPALVAGRGGFLLEDEHTVTECVEHIGLSQGRISTHLGCPSDCGYVSVRRSGRFAYYRVADPRVADLVLLARALAADNAAALAACMRIEPATPTP